VSKVFWFDCETTGTDPQICALVQLAYIIEIDGEEVDEGEIHFRPHTGAIISPEALKVNARSREDLMMFPEVDVGFLELKRILNKYIDRYNRDDKFVIAGYNVNFDDQFLRELFNRMGDDYFGSYFMWPKLDVAAFVAQHKIVTKGFKPKNYKLATVCSEFGITFKPHDALEDIRATKSLYNAIYAAS
jgi:DNA polymerase-3 subunit epsilon